MAVAHLAFQLGSRHQGRHRVDHQNIDGARADQRVNDLQRLLAVIRLGDQQLVDIDAELAGVAGVERVLGVDEGAGAARLLRLGYDMQRQGGLARAFRAVDLDDTALRHAADAKRDVEPERPGGDRLHRRYLAAAAELHDRALAEGAFDLRQSGIKRLLPVLCGFNQPQRRCGHSNAPKFRICPLCTILFSFFSV